MKETELNFGFCSARLLAAMSRFGYIWFRYIEFNAKKSELPNVLHMSAHQKLW